ncbi:probable sphingolipid transporter spinster homolog 2 isoform X2 [Lingula anatina]|uniref:Probable sphingolipid transporter spinster homolog 2 isoform X2 n=1 Tax=Lingula anatina TaxID=7574 RepID=A0A1S3JUV8_LINAN|nr:probable sphingolipid transporter spinster homolog 2 isoform X2 [Lingula anatina]|eukprot:XP_013414102.1 probable sphingolipid transporter spinster homolog 2 isoform X2 [Lingula anatina]
MELNERPSCYSVYVLVVLVLVFLFNQLDRYILVTTNASMAQELKYGDRVCIPSNATAIQAILDTQGENITPDAYCANTPALCDPQEGHAILCGWKYLGTGIEYQMLAGPVFILFFTFAGVPLGITAEITRMNRTLFLSVILMLWSLMTVLTGLAQAYWHIAICRILLGLFEAGCTPFAVSILSEYFTKDYRGVALGIYNLGIYAGYGFSFLANIIDRTSGWRTVYYIAGSPGIAIALLLYLTVKEPQRNKLFDYVDGTGERKTATWKFLTAMKFFVNPVLMCLCIGGAIRQGGGYTWAYNIKNYFDHYFPSVKTEDFMTWIPTVFGAGGAVVGGMISDRLASKSGITSRLKVLVLSQVVAAPFAVLTLYVDPPFAFIMQIPAFFIGDMWIGVCLAVVIDLTPPQLRTSAVAIYMFIITAIGGNLLLLLPSLSTAMNDMRGALVVLYPTLFGASAVAFLVTIFVFWNIQRKKMKVVQERTPLILNIEEDTTVSNESLHNLVDTSEEKYLSLEAYGY